MRARNKIAFALVAATALTVGISHDFESMNSPDILAPDYEKRADVLNITRRAVLPLEHLPASDDYYADASEGIARRWNDGGTTDYKYLTKKEVLAMTPEQIAKLSPPEKFDIFLGDYSDSGFLNRGFSLTKRVKKQAKDRGEDRGWEGICHGWTSSGINHSEPEPVTVKNADGVEIRFGSSDVKALLSYSYTSRSGSGYAMSRQVGDRCRLGKIDPNLPIPAACSDVNPGAFHVVLLNQIANKKQSFIADIDNTLQVWNQPISGYQILDVQPVASYPGMSPNAKSAQKIQIIMEYVAEIHPTWEPVVGTANQRIEGLAYEYYIDLNSSGEIIGGKWLRSARPEKIRHSDGTVDFGPITQWSTIDHAGNLQHPDFLWIAEKAPRYGIWKTFMEKIYKPRQFN